MLTLDDTTLFYYTLSLKDVRKPSGIINDWRKIVEANSAPKLPTKAASARSSSTLTSKTHTSTLVATVPSKSKPELTVEASNHDDTADNAIGGLSDEDETWGVEQQAAVTSPPKNGKRATSSVGVLLNHNCNILLT